MDHEQNITDKELSAYLRISVSHLKYWRSVGYGPVYSKSRRGLVEYEPIYIDMWLRSCMVDPAKDPAQEEEISLVNGAFEIYVGRPGR